MPFKKNITKIEQLSSEKQREYFEDLEYDVVVSRKEGKYYLYIPELMLTEVDENVDRAFVKLKESKSRFFSNMISTDRAGAIILPQRVRWNRDIIEFLQGTFLKYALIGSFLFMIFSGVGVLASKQLRKIHPTSILRRLNRAVVYYNNHVPEHEKEETLKEFEVFVNDMRPYLNLLKGPQDETKNED